MEKLMNETALWIGLMGGFLAWLLGGWDVLLISLVVLVALDYITGVLRSIVECRLCSDIGFKGIVKKVLIFIIVAAASAVQVAVQKNIPLREMVMMFFLANEGISILENAAQMGIPVPARFKRILMKLRDDESDKEDSNGTTGN